MFADLHSYSIGARNELCALILGEATPNSIGLLNRKSVLAALGDHWAGATDSFRLDDALATAWPALAFRMEEHFSGVIAARTFKLPLPVAGSWHW